MLKPLFAVQILVVVLGLCALGEAKKEKAVKSKTALTPDEIAIYQAILQENAPGAPDSLNVSMRTYPFDIESPLGGVSNNECLKGIELQNLADLAHSFHDLTPQVLVGKNMKLVDPDKQLKIVRKNDPSKTIRSATDESVRSSVHKAFSTALFSLSEIAFDKEHRYAVVSYEFYCGSLCAHGYTIVFEKVGNEWHKTDRLCSGWIS
jgi:hypothetical protein